MWKYRTVRLIGNLDDTIRSIISAKEELIRDYPTLDPDNIYLTVDTTYDDGMEVNVLLVGADVEPNENDMKIVESDVRGQLRNISRKYPGLIEKLLSEGL